jgi:FkbH-like protein
VPLNSGTYIDPMPADSTSELDYCSLVSEAKRAPSDPNLPEIRIALLGDAATQQFVPLLRALLRRAGFEAVVYEGPFAGIELEVYDAASPLYRFQPDCIALLNATQALRVQYFGRRGTASEFLRETVERLERIWSAIQARSTALILQSNYVLPTERLFGNFDHKVADSLYSVAATVNSQIAERARTRAGVMVNDVEAVASWVGRRTWFDERLWFLAKTFCALEHLPRIAQNMVQIVLASRGRVVKCVILDLDNTLWGGVIGDDGVNGIQLSCHGDGEPFHLLQSFLRELARRGILLAVCSKNDMHNAMHPFLSHPDMALKQEDIAVFVANWDDKAQNIRRIQETLNISFDSMVFLDDNPFERNLVRELLPCVMVPELPEDPADYLSAISSLNLFETTSFSTEDQKRTEMYQVDAERRQERASYATVEDFLNSLEMQITVEPWDEFHLPRIAQLIQRSNQFNLTTRRLSEAQCEAMMRDGTGFLTLFAKLTDRLGDHGLISVVTCEASGTDLAIRDWLMSCRVLARTVEQYLMVYVFDCAKRLGLNRVTGEYLATPKNAMVRDFFVQFGFQKISEEANGHTRWALSLKDFRPPVTYIRQTDNADLATISS